MERLAQRPAVVLPDHAAENRALFATWFGTTSPAACQSIQKRVEIVLNLNRQCARRFKNK